mmetsp:Transcript_37789/g.84275  ORF Transcript_37789/g.84275 Transcript_37789/m.84275 type:complete len:560 (-) Transcript_37789:572-2251(-)
MAFQVCHAGHRGNVSSMFLITLRGMEEHQQWPPQPRTRTCIRGRYTSLPCSLQQGPCHLLGHSLSLLQMQLVLIATAVKQQRGQGCLRCDLLGVIPEAAQTLLSTPKPTSSCTHGSVLLPGRCGLTAQQHDAVLVQHLSPGQLALQLAFRSQLGKPLCISFGLVSRAGGKLHGSCRVDLPCKVGKELCVHAHFVGAGGCIWLVPHPGISCLAELLPGHSSCSVLQCMAHLHVLSSQVELCCQRLGTGDHSLPPTSACCHCPLQRHAPQGHQHVTDHLTERVCGICGLLIGLEAWVAVDQLGQGNCRLGGGLPGRHQRPGQSDSQRDTCAGLLPRIGCTCRRSLLYRFGFASGRCVRGQEAAACEAGQLHLLLKVSGTCLKQLRPRLQRRCCVVVLPCRVKELLVMHIPGHLHSKWKPVLQVVQQGLALLGTHPHTDSCPKNQSPFCLHSSGAIQHLRPLWQAQSQRDPQAAGVLALLSCAVCGLEPRGQRTAAFYRQLNDVAALSLLRADILPGHRVLGSSGCGCSSCSSCGCVWQGAAGARRGSGGRGRWNVTLRSGT